MSRVRYWLTHRRYRAIGHPARGPFLASRNGRVYYWLVTTEAKLRRLA